ncbi:MAG: carboxypeptidase-like regulatory domain-containing protein [Candidatus Hydrogenedentota bacterium]
MSERLRMLSIVAVVFSFGGILWLVLGDTESTEPERIANTTSIPEPRRDSIPVFEFDAARSDDFRDSETRSNAIETNDESGARVSGHIFDLDTGEGIPGITVNAFYRGDKAAKDAVATSNETGEYELRGLGVGAYDIVHNLVEGYLFQKDRERAQDVTLTANQLVTGIDFGVAVGLSVSGVITDETGAPVEGVRVKHYSGASGYPETTSLADGRYTLEQVAEGEFDIVFSASGYQRVGLEDVESGVNTADVVLPRAGSISGQVVDAVSGQYITDFSVAVVRAEGISPRPSKLTRFQDDQGRFTVEYDGNDVKPYVHVRARGYVIGGAALEGELGRGESRREVVVSLSPERFLSGRVVDDQGDPIPGAGIFLGAILGFGDGLQGTAKAISDEDGYFTTTGLPGGEQILSAYMHEYAVDSRVLVLGHNTPEVQFVLGPGNILEGIVTLDGAPIYNARVTHFFRNRDNSTGSKSARTSADGRFKMLGLPTGIFAIRGSFNEKEIERRIHVEVEMVDGMRTEVEFAFVTTTNSVEGLLLNADNEPVMTYVSVTIDTGSYTEIRSAGAMGGYRFDSLPAGDVTISGTDQSSNEREVLRARLNENEQLQLDIVFDGVE